MNWKRLFTAQILERGYDYYCDDAVENMEIAADSIRADVIGTEEYEVEITLRNGEAVDMYCSCPYAEDGNRCKHMAAVLYQWSEEGQEAEESGGAEEDDSPKTTSVEELVREADIDVVRSYLVSLLKEDEKLLLRFRGMVKKGTTKEDIKRYVRQIDRITDRYLGRDGFISYYEADGFLSEMNEILDADVRRMVDDGDYMSAFALMNHMFTVLGDVAMDDSDGGTGMLAGEIEQYWREILSKADMDVKQQMFRWFTEHLDGSVIDYLEEYIEQVIMEEFQEKEFREPKLQFIKDMIEKSSLQSDSWSGSYHTGKWATRYLGMIEKQKNSGILIEEFCRKHWRNSLVRRYYIEFCTKKKEYAHALEALDESMALDKEYRGLVAEYSNQKKEIFLLQGNQEAYRKQLWKLVLEDDPGKLHIYRELKKQYPPGEWKEKREEVFANLPGHVRPDELYKEEKLYDRLLELVTGSPGLNMLQQYEDVLKKDYPGELLQKYKEEVDKMAMRTGDRSKYRQLVALLCRMKKITGGSKVAEEIAAEWRGKYRNRRAMMDELGRL